MKRKKEQEKRARQFQNSILVYLDAAYNYARWLTGNSHDAEDLTQDACARAYAAFGSFRHKNPKSWLLTIVRNTFLTHKQKAKQAEVIYLDSATQHGHPVALQEIDTPEAILLRNNDARLIQQAISQLDIEFREMIILRELEGLNYREIATITDCPLGTVMSRLSRARKQLKSILNLSIEYQEGGA
jgi:RNA polymerase sigma-70 factor (ECF subfamily)